jgi:hypothetical protein
MSPNYKSLLMRYQNYLIEFYQLIEDKELIKPSDLAKSAMVRDFLENLPDFETDFEIEFKLSTHVDDLENTWLAQFNLDGFSVRSYTLDGLDEIEQWYFHYRDDTKEYEGNLFTDGDWDLFLDEIAEIDQFGDTKLNASFNYAFE